MTIEGATFPERLEKSFPAVFRVAVWLRHQGFEVGIPVPRIRPDVSQRMEYMDDGDINCVVKIEVKQSPFEFTCEDDYPKSNILIGDTYKVDRNFWNTAAYAIVSASRTHVAWVSYLTADFWRKLDINDNCDTYGCPKRLAAYYELKPDQNYDPKSPNKIGPIFVRSS